MTNEDILRIAMAQSAIDSGCSPQDFCASENRIVHSAASKQARAYLSLPFFCDLVSYGTNIVASVDPLCEEAVRDYLSRYPQEHCFETPNLHVLNDALEKQGYRVCFMAEYFLPDVKQIAPCSCGYEMRLMTPDVFASYYLPEWSNALCEKRRYLDRLAIGAFDNGKLIGMAGASEDCASMWQIGIDVLPAYRRQGIASALTKTLAYEILSRGIVPFYCAAWSNIASVRNAVKSGFLPAWVQLTAKPIAFVQEINSGE